MLLALDLGLHCGWSLWGDGRYLASGVWHLGHDRNLDRGDEFLLRALAKVQANKVRRLAYEHIASIHQHASADAAHLFGGWLMLLGIVARRTRVELQRVQQPEVYAASGVKKATPKNYPDRAVRREENKRRLVEAARRRFPTVTDDNEADACFVALAAMAQRTGAA